MHILPLYSAGWGKSGWGWITGMCDGSMPHDVMQSTPAGPGFVFWCVMCFDRRTAIILVRLGRSDRRDADFLRVAKYVADF